VAYAVVVRDDVSCNVEGGASLPFGVPPYGFLRRLGDEVGCDPPELPRPLALGGAGRVPPLKVCSDLPGGSALPRGSMTFEDVVGRKRGSYPGRVS
jgi:hypothetical protein